MRAFWRSPGDWPLDGPDTIFLARAVDQLGAARFKEHWIGLEGAGEPVPFPERDDWGLTAKDLFRAAKLIDVRAHALWVANTPTSAGLIFGEDEHSPNANLSDEEAQRIAQDEFNDDQWDRAKLLADGDEFGGPDRAAQWDRVIEELADALAHGSVVGRLQSAQGGASWEMNASWWNIRDRKSRFITCELNEADYPLGQPKLDDFGDENSDNKPCHIFVDAQSFRDYLSTELIAGARELPRHLSPFMLAMLHVARKLDIAPDNKEVPVDQIMEELEAYWRARSLDLKYLSDERQSLMATLLREPGQPRGRGKRNLAAKSKP